MEDRPPELRHHWFVRPIVGEAAGPAVVTGVFDLLHVGHVRFLAAVRRHGRPLFVGVEDDRRVTAWKGPRRPVNTAAHRAELLSTLRSVDAVFIISGDPAYVTAEHYLPLLADLRPGAIAYSAGDRYAEAKRRSASALGAEACEIPLISGLSTTELIARIRSADLLPNHSER